MLNNNLKVRDEWDCLVEYIIGSASDDPNTKMSSTALLEGFADYKRNSLFPSTWEKSWLRRRAGLSNPGDSPSLSDNLDGLASFVECQPWFDEESYKTHRGIFFSESRHPRSRHPNFIGRENYLTEIHKQFEKGTSTVCLATSLHAIGGQGKTALASEYSAKYQDSYKSIIWINLRTSDKPVTEIVIEHIEEIVRECSIQRGQSFFLKSEGTIEERLSHYLKDIAHFRRGINLIVLDDVPAVENKKNHPGERTLSLIFKALEPPLGTRFRILATSRRKLLSQSKNVMNIELLPLEPEEAKRLFLTVADDNRFSKEDEKLTELVVHKLGGHPLSISLIASYVRENGIEDLSAINRKIEEKIVDSIPIKDSSVFDYPDPLAACLDLTVESLSDEARLLLWTLSLFRQGPVAQVTLRACIDNMPSESASELISRFKETLASKTKKSAPIESLRRFSLLDQSYSKEKTLYLGLHEIVFDFAMFDRSRHVKVSDLGRIFNSIEDGLTEGAALYASQKINADKISFVDVEAITGILIPNVNEARSLVPSSARIETSLEFWFHHMKFQNFVYDTGLQELLLGQLERLYDETRKSSLAPHHELILLKLLGHAYYARPQESGKLAEEFFRKAIELARQLISKRSNKTIDPELRWYLVFLLDHSANVLAKQRPKKDRSIPVRADRFFIPIFDEIETALPRSFVNFHPINQERDCELLLRAAHYWGHRGNQDAFVIFCRSGEDRPKEENDKLFESARNAYLAATYLRLLGLKIFRRGQFEYHVAKFLRSGEIPFMPKWMDTVDLNMERTGYETFTSLSQGIGDSAHQLRGYHSVCVYDFLRKDDERGKADILEEASKALAGARRLWRIAENSLESGEVLLKYRLWMESSEILMSVMESNLKGAAYVKVDEVIEEFDDRCAMVQKNMKSAYPHAVTEQKTILSRIIANFGTD